jgi:hypothetical protein
VLEGSGAGLRAFDVNSSRERLPQRRYDLHRYDRSTEVHRVIPCGYFTY